MKYLGLDIGTTSICGIVYDTEQKKLVSVLTETNDSAEEGVYPWERAQNPERIWMKCESAIERLSQQHHDICGIGVAGQMHGILYLDELGHSVSPLYTWQDQRGASLMDDRTYAEWVSEQTEYPLATGYGIVTHLYNQLNNLIPEAACRICTVSDYIVMRLAGLKVPMMDPSHAAGIGCFNPGEFDFDKDALHRAGIERSWLPPVSASGSLAGYTPDGIPVFTAMGDNQASFLGSVKDLCHSVLLNIGTGGQISIYDATGLAVPEGMEARPFPGGGRLLVGSSLCGGKAYALLEQFFRQVVSSFTGQPVSSREIYAWMERLAGSSVEQRHDRLIVNTQFLGTRKNPGQRGHIGNISMDNFLPGHVVRGFNEGIIDELHSYFKRLPEVIQQSVTSLVGAGNAIRINGGLREEAIHRFGLPLHVPIHSEEGAVGAALMAAVGNGEISSFEAAGQSLG